MKGHWTRNGCVREKRMVRALTGLFLLTIAVGVGCFGNAIEEELRIDAEFDPVEDSDVSRGVRESNVAVAQTFTVLSDGLFQEFWIVLKDGISADDGIIQITVRPLNVDGEPDNDFTTSIIDPIDVDTSTLPTDMLENFTVFEVLDDPAPSVLVGDKYAIVVEFQSRATMTDTDSIALILGQSRDLYLEGTGSTSALGVNFTNNTEDYFFRTFLFR